MDRAALLICCSKGEFAEMHRRAALDRRKISSYILSIVMPSIEFEEALYARYHRLSQLNVMKMKMKMKMKYDEEDGSEEKAGGGKRKRTAVLLRCSNEESMRVRAAAQRRDATISKFVLFIVRRSWEIADAKLLRQRLSRTAAEPVRS
jgi:hypothetical protein